MIMAVHNPTWPTGTGGYDAKQHSAPTPREPIIPIARYFGTARPNNSELNSADVTTQIAIEKIMAHSTTDAVVELPSYDDLVDAEVAGSSRRGSAAASRVRTPEPRIEEGCEILPEYSCTVTAQAVFQRKMEYESCVHKAKDRNWYKVFVEIQGTALRIHRIKNKGFTAISKDMEIPSADLPPWCVAGELLKSYTLQHGDVGVAADYQKRRYVIRLRIETDQFLLSCMELQTVVKWLELLSAAIDLSHPLESRSLPQEYALPRRRRRRNTTNDASNTRTDISRMANNEEVMSVQRYIMSTQFPRLADRQPGTQVAESPRMAFLRSRAESEPLRSRSISSATSVQSGEASRPTLTRTTSAAESLSSSSSSSTSTLNQSPSSPPQDLHPSISPETGKWEPEQNWTQQYDLLMAKRCMAVLLKKSKRKSDVVIMKGQEWFIYWETGRLDKVGLPSYTDLSAFEADGVWMLERGERVVNPYAPRTKKRGLRIRQQAAEIGV